MMPSCTSVKDKVLDREASDNALCAGLKEPVDSLANSLLKWQKNTPSEVITEGTRVIKGYDSEC